MKTTSSNSIKCEIDISKDDRTKASDDMIYEEHAETYIPPSYQDNKAVILSQEHIQNRLLCIVRFVQDSIKHPQPAIQIVRCDKNPNVCIAKYSDWFTPHFRRWDEMMLIDTTGFYVAEDIQCFLWAKKQLGPNFPILKVLLPRENQVLTNQDLEVLKCHSTFWNDIRKHALSDVIAKIKSKREKQSKKDFNKATKMVDILLEQYSKLLALRVDLFFKHPPSTVVNGIHSGNPIHKEHCLELLKSEINHFFNNIRRNSKLNNILAFFIKFEHGMGRGFHAHCLFFLDANEFQNDYFHAQQIGEYWVKITNGLGSFENCNQSKKRYKYPCLGTIHYTDAEKINNLKYFLIRYLCKSDQYFLYRPLVAYRRIQSTQISTLLKKRNQKGRPRKYESKQATKSRQSRSKGHEDK